VRGLEFTRQGSSTSGFLHETESFNSLVILPKSAVKPEDTLHANTTMRGTIVQASSVRNPYVEGDAGRPDPAAHNKETIKDLCDSVFRASKGNNEQEFEHVSILGAGDFSLVSRERRRLDGQTYAIKRTTKKFNGDADRLAALQEVFVLSSLPAHPNIVRYYGAWLEKGGATLSIQLEDCTNGTLENLFFNHSRAIDTSAELKLAAETVPAVLVSIFSQTAQALAHVHSHGLIHMDVKPGNLFLASVLRKVDDPDLGLSLDFPEVRLGDFGLACRADGSDFSMEGDARYLCPSLLRLTGFKDECMGTPDEICANYKAADVFALGVTMVELCTRERVENGGKLWSTVREENGESWKVMAETLVKRVGPVVAQCVLDCLKTESSARPTANELVERLGRDGDSAKVRELEEKLARMEQELGELKANASNRHLSA